MRALETLPERQPTMTKAYAPASEVIQRGASLVGAVKLTATLRASGPARSTGGLRFSRAGEQ